MTGLLAIAWILASALAFATAYRAIFTLAYLASTLRNRQGDLAPSPRPPVDSPRFAVVIPAHNEELLISGLLQSIRSANYPRERIEIFVAADNCSDRTAEIVRESGATVFERFDPANPGKGQAIAWILERLDLKRFDAVAFIDADNLVDPEFFAVMQRELVNGGRCLQGYCGITNPNDSTMTRLMTVANVIKNLLHNGGKARLGLSVILIGTGMVFRGDVLALSGWSAMSIGEDLEHSLHLLENGESIRFVPDAITNAQEASSLSQGYVQRQRWASGRNALANRAGRAMREGLRRRSLTLFDAGLSLILPSNSSLLNWTLIVGSITLIGLPTTTGPALLVAGALAYQVAEGLIALVILRANAAFIRSLAFAPIFLVWKLGIDALALIGHRRHIWARTSRNPHSKEAGS